MQRAAWGRGYRIGCRCGVYSNYIYTHECLLLLKLFSQLHTSVVLYSQIGLLLELCTPQALSSIFQVYVT